MVEADLEEEAFTAAEILEAVALMAAISVGEDAAFREATLGAVTLGEGDTASQAGETSVAVASPAADSALQSSHRRSISIVAAAVGWEMEDSAGPIRFISQGWRGTTSAWGIVRRSGETICREQGCGPRQG